MVLENFILSPSLPNKGNPFFNKKLPSVLPQVYTLEKLFGVKSGLTIAYLEDIMEGINAGKLNSISVMPNTTCFEKAREYF